MKYSNREHEVRDSATCGPKNIEKIGLNVYIYNDFKKNAEHEVRE